jgi:hypothetical protein
VPTPKRLREDEGGEGVDDAEGGDGDGDAEEGVGDDEGLVEDLHDLVLHLGVHDDEGAASESMFKENLGKHRRR